MAKEHKKLYKAGKNWIVATLTATTITLLGGIGAYTAHADTTAENNQSTETSNISQSSQSDNSSNSVVLTQPVTTQSNQIALSNQSEQSTPTNQATSTATMNITTTNSFNKVTPNNYGVVNENSNPLLTQKYSDNSSLWYHPSVDYHFDNEIAGSGTGEDQTIAVQDPYQPSITTYYSFANFSDNPEISQYAHKTVSRIIYLKNPQTGLESVDGQAQVNFNRWIAIDKDYNNQLVGAGPWITSLVSPTSFPEYDIPQMSGYTSYCNGEKAKKIEAEDNVSGNQPDEIYHITYKSDIKNVTRTIIITKPNGDLDTTVQNAELSDFTNVWPTYIIPQYEGYDSYVDDQKATSIPEQIVNNDSITVNVTYRRRQTISTNKQQHKTITRTINIYELNGHIDTITQSVRYTRPVFHNEDEGTSYGNWTAEGNSSWDEYVIPQHEGYKSQYNLHDAKIISSQYVSPNDRDINISVTYVKTDTSKGNGNVEKINTTNTGWNQQGDHWLYMQDNGYLAKGWNYLNGHWYYFDPESAYALTNWQDINNHWYYFDPINAWAKTGWFKSGAGYWYFFDYTNAWALTSWAKLNNHWYYFDNINANALTGWQSINSHWYYFDPTNAWARTGWQWINGHWYWFDEANAWALTGWQYYGGQWYFMDQQNAWMDTGWTTNLANGQLYYLDKNGHPLTGWQRSLNGFWYYLQPGSDAAAIGWNWINGHWYYFNPEETINGIKAKGAMFTGRHFIDNRWNRFDLNGHWLGYEN